MIEKEVFLQAIAIISIFLFLVFLITYVIYESSKNWKRSGFRDKIEKLVESSGPIDSIVKAMHYQAYHYMQEAESVKNALTYILKNNSDFSKTPRIVELLDRNDELIAVLDLPEQIQPIMWKLYQRTNGEKSDIINISWWIRTYEKRSRNKKFFLKILSIVGTVGGTLAVKFIIN